MSQIDPNHFTAALKALLHETFYKVDGHFLDRGDSLFETLAQVSAAEASLPVGGRCATLAAQVKHTAYYLEVVVDSIQSVDFPGADWGLIWQTVSAVDEAEWAAIQAEMHKQYERIIALIDGAPAWPTEAHLAGAIAVVAHSAYHLGEIRQALCTLKNG